jgi:outer membrane protein OmpA-like peptidoglycan-associated protein
VLTPGAKQNLSEFATALRNPLLVEKRFLIEGHTDAKGGHRYNLELSKRRAAAVVQFLTEQGVDKAHLFARGYGETKPRATDPFNPANRRVEARVTE